MSLYDELLAVDFPPATGRQITPRRADAARTIRAIPTYIVGVVGVGAAAEAVQVQIAQYIDRNPTVSELTYAATVAPHAVTTRSTFTVSTPGKARLQSLLVMLRRATAATTAVRVEGYIRTAGGALRLIARVLPAANNTADDHTDEPNEGFPNLDLLQGEVIEMRTEDPSTGGTVEFFETLRAVSYDA